jgi:glucokinase
MILAGDVGGTKTRIALYERRDGRLRQEAEETYASAEHASLSEIVERFRARHAEEIASAGFGVAGPVEDGVSHLTNLAWTIDAAAFARELGLERVELLNDLVSTAHGIAEVAPEKLVTLQPGEGTARGNQAVVAAGTGLGQAGLFWDGHEHAPFGSESGHADFAPANELEDALVGYLRTEFGHVSVERVISGPGLHNVYRFLRDTGRGEEPASLRREIEEGDPAAVISRAALEQRVPIAEAALELFVSAYGSQAGNFALAVLATGGVWIGGGIAPKILPKLKEGSFVRAFREKSKLSELLRRIPIRVVTDDRAALLGAARKAWLESERARSAAR